MVFYSPVKSFERYTYQNKIGGLGFAWQCDAYQQALLEYMLVSAICLRSSPQSSCFHFFWYRV